MQSVYSRIKLRVVLSSFFVLMSSLIFRGVCDQFKINQAFEKKFSQIPKILN
jgi:hypothetical protein